MNTIAMIFLAATASHHLPPGLLSAVCYVESRHTVIIINRYDGDSPSYGICQLKFETAKQVGYTGNADSLLSLKTNVEYAARYLAHKIELNDGDVIKGVAAYNAGTYRINSDGVPLNMSYIRNVLDAWRDHR